MSTVTIVGGRLRTLGIERPSNDRIVTLAAAAIANGFGLAGSGLIRTVTGSTIEIVVGPAGCSCSLWRNGTYCHHMALLAIETAKVTIEKRAPTPMRARRERAPLDTAPVVGGASDPSVPPATGCLNFYRIPVEIPAWGFCPSRAKTLLSLTKEIPTMNPMTPERRAEAIRLFLPFVEIADALQLPVEDAEARLQHWARTLVAVLTDAKIQRAHQTV